MFLKTAYILILMLGFSACAPAGRAENCNPGSEGIVNGKDIPIRQTLASKSVVLIEGVNDNFIALALCTGTVIGQNTILTAAHCFDPYINKGLVSRFIIHFENSYRTVSNPQIRIGDIREAHPGYQAYSVPKAYDNDLAVISFHGTLPFGFQIAKIETDRSLDYSGHEVVTYGYGRKTDFTGIKKKDAVVTSGILREGFMVVNPDYAEMGPTYSLSSPANEWVCKGDSGGANFVTKDGTPTIIGVNSTVTGTPLPEGKQTCAGKSTSIKVSEYADWILKTQKKLSKLTK